MEKKGILIMGGALIAFILIMGVYGFLVNYEYERQIGAYMENAYEVNTPELMIKNIDLAVGGMRNAGITGDDYGAIIFKKPDNKMSYQYEFLENFKERAQAVIIWREANYAQGSTTGGVEALGDVYEQKMDNLREFLKEGGRADWITQDTWYIQHHPIVYIYAKVMGAFPCMDILAIGVVLFLMFGKKGKKLLRF